MQTDEERKCFHTKLNTKSMRKLNSVHYHLIVFYVEIILSYGALVANKNDVNEIETTIRRGKALIFKCSRGSFQLSR